MVLESKNDFARHEGLAYFSAMCNPCILVWAYGMWLMVMIVIDNSMACMRRMSILTSIAAYFNLYSTCDTARERERERIP